MGDCQKSDEISQGLCQGFDKFYRKTLVQVLLLGLVGCGGGQKAGKISVKTQDSSAGTAVPGIPASAGEQGGGQGCRFSELTIQLEGCGAFFNDAAVKTTVLSQFQPEGSLSYAPQHGPGRLEVSVLLVETEDSKYSLGLRLHLETVLGELREVFEVSATREVSRNPAEELEPMVQGLSSELEYVCRVATAPGAALAELRSEAEGNDSLLFWARTCGDRRASSCLTGLRELLRSSDSRVRLAAVASLGQLQDEDSVEVMIAGCAGASPEFNRAVLLALDEIGTEKALRYLKDWGLSHPDPQVRGLAGVLVKER